MFQTFMQRKEIIFCTKNSLIQCGLAIYQQKEKVTFLRPYPNANPSPHPLLIILQLISQFLLFGCWLGIQDLASIVAYVNYVCSENFDTELIIILFENYNFFFKILYLFYKCCERLYFKETVLIGPAHLLFLSTKRKICVIIRLVIKRFVFLKQVFRIRQIMFHYMSSRCF